MASKVKFSFASFKPPASFARLFWRSGIWVSLALVVAFAGLLWFSGMRDGQQAFEDGRRLSIRLEDGVVEGRQAGDLPPVQVSKQEEKPVPASPSDETKKADEAAKEEAPKEGQEKVDPALATSVVPSVSAVRGINAALTEPSKDGLLPKIGADGTKPWHYYSKQVSPPSGTPVIAIIVTGLGTSKTLTEQALKLPENITLSFSPYARNVESWATAARVTGHEIMVDLPVQPADYPASDPGPYGLLLAASEVDNEQKLQWLMSRFGAFTGFLTPLNDGFIHDTKALTALVSLLGKRGLILALPHDVANDEQKKLLQETTNPVLVADVLLDEDLTEAVIKARITSLQQQAKDKGYAVGIAQSYPITLKQLAALPEQLEKEGFALVPLSYVAKQKFK